MDMYKNKKSSYKSRVSTDSPRQLRVMILTKTDTNIRNYFVTMQEKMQNTAILTLYPIVIALRTQFKMYSNSLYINAFLSNALSIVGNIFSNIIYYSSYRVILVNSFHFGKSSNSVSAKFAITQK